MNFDAGRADRFCAKFPAQVELAETIPCSRELIPCSSAQGILSQTAEFADVFGTDFRKKRLNRRNSLHFSLPPGNSAYSREIESEGEPPRSRLSGMRHTRNMRIMLAAVGFKEATTLREGSFGRRPPDLFSLVLCGFGLLGFCVLHSPEIEVEQRLLFVPLVLILFTQAQNFLQHLYVETLSLGLGEDFFLALVQRFEFFLDLFDALDEGQNAITRDSSRVGHALPHVDGRKGYDGEGCRKVNDSIEIPD
jgi:hypothetical protein